MVDTEQDEPFAVQAYNEAIKDAENVALSLSATTSDPRVSFAARTIASKIAKLYLNDISIARESDVTENWYKDVK